MDAANPYAWKETFERLFSLSERELEQLKRLTTPSDVVEARRKLITEGKPCPGLFILKSGWLVESKLLRSGRRQILNYRLPGDVIGLECLAYKGALYSIATLTRSTLSPLSAKDFEETQQAFPRLASAFFLITLREEAVLHQWEVSLGARSAVPRIAHLLLELERRLRARGLYEGDAVRLPLTQEDLADSTGLTTPYVNRVLQHMRSKGLIHFEQQILNILDRAELAKQAGFDPDYIEGWGLGQARFASD